ncbi:unnamed protein product [Pylaiella littoralis]
MAKRRKGLKVSTLWLCTMMAQEVKKHCPDDPRRLIFKPSWRWAGKWANKRSIVKRRRSNSKNESVEQRLPKIGRFLKKLRALMYLYIEQCMHFDRTHKKIAPPLVPHNRLFILQVPLPFANGLVTTWADKGSIRVRVSQPSAGLDKRQCTMQLCFGPGDVLFRPGIIFRGTGTRISAVEKAAWHKGVDVSFQACAWADSNLLCIMGGQHLPRRGRRLFASNARGAVHLVRR